MAIRFSAKDQPGTPAAKDKKPAPAVDVKEAVTPPSSDSASDLFEPGAKKSPAKGRKRK